MDKLQHFKQTPELKPGSPHLKQTYQTIPIVFPLVYPVRKYTQLWVDTVRVWYLPYCISYLIFSRDI